MRWSILILIFLGLAAAASASLLTASLRTPNIQYIRETPEEGTVLVAARPLAALTRIGPDDVTSRTISLAQAPPHHLSDPVQAVGKVLIVPVVEGQPLTRTSFAPSGPGADMVTTLEPGMRAVTISLPPDSSLQGLLYPGCVVDVLSAFRVGRQEGGEALSTTLLESVRVLAIENRIVGMEQEETGRGGANSSGRRGNVLVTLMVDSRQAKALQLASEFGTVSLALRNPTDGDVTDEDATLLSGGRMAQMASLLESRVAVGGNPRPQRRDDGPSRLERFMSRMMESAAQAPSPEPAATPAPTPAPRPSWQIEILRAGTSETRSFPDGDR